jgi:DNA-binding NarL/FixJ family response regulator
VTADRGDALASLYPFLYGSRKDEPTENAALLPIAHGVADVALQGLLVYARLKLDRSLALVARLPTADAESGGYGIEQPAAGTHRRRIMIGVAMPGLNGIETVKRARQRWPFLRVLYVTGYVDIGRRRAAATRL